MFLLIYLISLINLSKSSDKISTAFTKDISLSDESGSHSNSHSNQICNYRMIFDKYSDNNVEDIEGMYNRAFYADLCNNSICLYERFENGTIKNTISCYKYYIANKECGKDEIKYIDLQKIFLGVSLISIYVAFLILIYKRSNDEQINMATNAATNTIRINH